MKKVILYIFFLFISIILCLGLLLSLEIGFRLFVYEPSKGYMIDTALFPYHQYLVSSHQSNLILGKGNNILNSYFAHGECDDEGGVMVRFNSLGFRSPEFTNLPPKKVNEFRIIITGGSVAESWNIGEKCTLDRQLHEALTILHPEIDFKIFNLASGGWKSFQELIAIQLYGLDIQPDLVIALDGFNDVEHAYYMPINEAYSNGHIRMAFEKYKSWIKSGPLDLFKDFKIIYFIKGIFSPREVHAENYQSSKYPRYAIKAEPGKLATQLESLPVRIEEIKARTDFDPYNRQVVDNYLKDIRLMARSVSTVNAYLIVALQPTLYLKNPLSSDEERVLWKYYAPEVNFVVQGYIRISEELTKLSKKEQNMIFCDLSNIFDGDNRTIHGDYAHMNNIGYGIVADKLAKIIAKHIEAVRHF